MSGIVTATNAGTTLASATATQEEINLAAGLTAEGKRPEEKEAEPKTEPEKEAAPEAEAEPETRSEPEPEQEEEQEQQEAPVKGKGGFQRRIDKLTSKLRLTEQERDELREAQKQKAAEEPKPQPNSDKPLRENFITEDEWIDAYADWRDAKKESDAAEREEKQRQKTNFDNFNRQIDSFKETHEDYDDLLATTEIEIHKGVELALTEMDNGVAVGYYLLKNPDVAKKLREMSPIRAIAEAGAISRELLAKSTGAPAPDKKPERRASAPIQPVPAGSSKASLRLDDPNLSQADYNRIRDEQERQRRKL